jgi:dATP pyrophosphohydrolase
MARVAFQVLVLPYRQVGGSFEFALFSRSDYTCWQGIAGGGEDDETPLQAAMREAHEEAAIPAGPKFIPLDTICSIPVTCFPDSHLWGDDVYVIPEYSFGVDCSEFRITTAAEHNEFKWLPYEEAMKLLTYDSNRTALWELHQKIRGRGSRDLS